MTTEQNTEESNALQVIRWVGFLPAACIAAWLARYVINLFNLLFLGVTSDNFIDKLYSETVVGLAMGYVFVYVGARIAPAHRVIVEFILGGIAIVLVVLVLYPAVMIMNWWSIWSSVCVAVGAGSGVWSVHADKLYWRN